MVLDVKEAHVACCIVNLPRDGFSLRLGGAEDAGYVDDGNLRRQGIA